MDRGDPSGFVRRMLMYYSLLSHQIGFSGDGDCKADAEVETIKTVNVSSRVLRL
jgi:hypothetical protein